MTDLEKRALLRQILTDPKGAVAPGVTDPIFARLAADCGYSAVHLSGNAIHKSFCLPDRNLLTVTEIASRASQIADAADLPLIVDGGPAAKDTHAIARAVRSLERAGAAAIRFEDSYGDELYSKADEAAILPKSLTVDRIKAAVDAREDPGLVLIARCGARSGAPLVSLWPKTHMTVFEFLRLGFRIALMPSSVSLAALAAVKEMLLELKETGTERDYFSRLKNVQEVERWYRDLSTRGR